LLEGRWRAELGDLAGASLALARLREAVEAAVPRDADRTAHLAAMLVEASDIEENARGDLRAAQRHLGVALRLRPRDRVIGAAFRRVATELGRPMGPVLLRERAPVHDDEDEPRPLTLRSPVPAAPPSKPVSSSQTELPPDEEEEDEVLAEQLADQLRADPDDHDVARRLAGALERLGRDLELLALVSTRIEDGSPDIVYEFWPIRQDVLLRLAATARAEGRPSEAELYEQMSTETLA
jgi:hypothetical protein